MRAAARFAFVIVSLALGLVLFARLHHAGASIFFLAYGGIGGYLVVRRPANPIGWLLLLVGSGIELGSVQIDMPVPGEPLVTDVVSAIAVWGSGCGWSLAFLGVLCISLVFPEGRLPVGRAGRLSRLAIAIMAALVLAVCLNPVSNIVPLGGSLNTFVPNPLALAPDAAFWDVVPSIEALHYAMLALVVLGLGAMVVRARRATAHSGAPAAEHDLHRAGTCAARFSCRPRSREAHRVSADERRHRGGA